MPQSSISLAKNLISARAKAARTERFKTSRFSDIAESRQKESICITLKVSS